MKEHDAASAIALSALIILCCPVTAFADSSWVWISETRPYDVLPWVAILTLAIEAFSINYISPVHKLGKTCCVVALANGLSFAAPYLLNYLSFRGMGFEFTKYLEHWPSYTVGAIYGIMTVVIELPIVYYALRKHVENKKKLIIVIIGANIVTTCMVALAERLFCRGAW